MRLTLIVLALLWATFLHLSCSGSAPDETGVELTITFDRELDSLVISGYIEGGESFEQVTIPEEPQPLQSGERVLIYLLEELAGETLVIEVDGLMGGNQRAYGSTSVILVAGEVVPTSVRLDCIGEGCGDCNPADCSSGCCSSEGCQVPSAEHCGSGGEICVACDPRFADACSIEGECFCGTGLACTSGQLCIGGGCICNVESCPAGCCDGNICRMRSFESCAINGNTCFPCDTLTANTCSSEGECLCGTGPACEPGQNCLAGLCVCDSLSCDGCCEDNECREPSVATCGAHGSSCSPCSSFTSDGCDEEGQCRCGAGPPAGSGQQCVDGERFCTSASCPEGCCTHLESCETSSRAACGSAGEHCVECDLNRADRCFEGECLCGTAPMCEAGQRCDSGICVCDDRSCPGCCREDSCNFTPDQAACGIGGFPCVTCPVSDTCDDGVCSSCSPITCPDGCCIGAECVLPSAASCGTGGEACISCGLMADSCPVGECRCGSSSVCAEGQRCLGGGCVCDDVSCPDGCCDGDICITPPTLSSCGSSGDVCRTCAATLADNCSLEDGCRCGSGPSCVDGQRCDSGSCICDDISCPDGCCSGTSCEARSLVTCGINGEPCAACSSTRADNCSLSGTCQCGSGSACDVGQRCDTGTCLCGSTSCAGCCEGDTCRSGTEDDSCGTAGSDCITCPGGSTCLGGVCSGCNATTCPDSCCAGSTCVETRNVTACGTSGEACFACDFIRADSCVDGECRCGTSALCPEGLECAFGSCTCSALSCPLGCCDSSGCHTRSLSFCGIAGDTCMTCDTLTADSCNSFGQCRCGGGAACAEGLRCAGGLCICDEFSCPGCCDGGTCRPGDELRECGVGGVDCARCHPVFGECVDGVCIRI